jgi:flavin-dependent dehydrogenase
MPSALNELHDAVIIGGGPAGAVAGAYLARAGLRPLILEKEKFPRFAIGESLLPCGNDILKDLGVWPELEKGGFVKKYGADFTSGKSERFNRYWFRNALGKSYEHTFQVERAAFDQILLNRARSEGCEVMEGVRVSSVKENEKGFLTIIYDHSDGRQTVKCRWLIDASGRCGVAGTNLKMPKVPTRDRKMVAIYGHFSGVRRNSGEAAGHTVIVRFKEGWFWFIPLSSDKTSVGAVVPPDLLRENRGDLEKCFQHCLETTPDAKSRMGQAQSLQPLRATADYSWRFQSFAKNRVLLTGDAAGFVDPIFSSGVMLAMKSGRLAAEVIRKAELEKRALTAKECRAYTQEISGWMSLYGRIIRSFYDPAGFEIFMHPLPYFQIPRSIGYLVGGQMDLPLSQRLRIAVFGAICRLQQVLSIAPTIPSLR